MVAKLWPWIVALVAAVVAGVWVHELDSNKAKEVEIVRLTHVVKHTDSVFVTDTLVFTRVLKTVNTMHDSVYLHIHDSVYVTRFIGLQDSTIRACKAIIQDCNAVRAARDSLLKAYDKLRPSKIGLGIIAGCGVGFDGKPACLIGGGVSYKVF